MIGYYGNEEPQEEPTQEGVVNLDKVSDDINDAKLLDDSPMPFGNKHKGVMMKNVPASYLHWIWTNVNYYKEGTPSALVINYIYKRLRALKKECPDGIWLRPVELRHPKP